MRKTDTSGWRKYRNEGEDNPENLDVHETDFKNEELLTAS